MADGLSDALTRPVAFSSTKLISFTYATACHWLFKGLLLQLSPNAWESMPQKPGLIKFQNDLCNQGQDGNQVWFQFLWTHWSFIFHSWVPSTILFDTCVCCVLATGTGQCRHSTHFTPAWCSEVQLQLLFFYTKASNVSEGAVALSEIWTRTVHWGCALSANKFHPYCAILDTRKKWAQLNTDWIDL